MRTWHTREELLAQVVTLACDGMSARAIARAVGASRNTVRKLLEAHRDRRETAPKVALPRPPARAPRALKLDPFRPRIIELLDRYGDITAQRIFEELTADGYDGGDTQVKTLVRTLRPPKRPEPSWPTPVYGPGEMAESDWSPYVIDFTHAARTIVQACAYALVYSTRKHFSLHERSDIYALMDGHVRAFDRFQGAAHNCKYDGQKAVVLGWEGRQPIYNPRFLAFSAYYEFRPVACRPRHPNDKPRVERALWEFERSFLNGRTFRDLADMRAQLRVWMDRTADPRPRRPRALPSRMELFAQEQPRLRSLPRHPYDTARVVYRLCSIDGFVAWDGNRYAVPYEHITDILPLRITPHELLVYAADLRCVARHELAPRSAGQDVGAQAHHPRTRPQDGRGTADLDQLRQAFGDMDDSARAFLDTLCAAMPRQATYHARRILLLRERYGTADLCAALRHARAYGALEHHAVERILDVHAVPRRLAEYVAEDLAHRLAASDPGRPQPADLTHYDQLPVAGHRPAPQEDPCPDDTHPPTSSSSGSDTRSRSSD